VAGGKQNPRLWGKCANGHSAILPGSCEAPQCRLSEPLTSMRKACVIRCFDKAGTKLARVAAALALLGSYTPGARLGPIAPDFPELCRRADVIVVGECQSIQERGPTEIVEDGARYPARLVVVQVKVERVLKGSAGPTVSYAFKVPTAPVMDFTVPSATLGQFGVFFLIRRGAQFELASPNFPLVPAAPGAPEAPGDVLDRVAAEVAHVVESPAAERTKEQAVALLAALGTKSATEALMTFTADRDVNIALGAMGVLLARNEISYLPDAARLLLSSNPAIHEENRDATAAAIGYGVKDPRAIPVLVHLLQSDDMAIRRGAAAALRNTGSPAAAGPLAQALYDPDRDVRYYAVVGLGEITGQNEWTPSVDNFNKNEQRFLNHWREWARENNFTK
jgi:hypothetical protein